eukprot:scaffold162_cov267-Chaetoceros_neogracile.AAC.18
MQEQRATSNEQQSRFNYVNTFANMEKRKEALLVKFKSAGQDQVFQYWDSLSSIERSLLLDQLESIEVHKLGVYLLHAATNESTAVLNQTIQPFSGKVGKGHIFQSAEGLDVDLYQVGMNAIRSNKVATVLLAGGQGTRLGFSGPKGMYDIGLSNGKTLFCLISERIVKISQLAKASQEQNADVKIPLYIMTSPMNHEETKAYFESNHYFGLQAQDVIFFSQGVLPCLSPDGKILMEKPYQCSVAPDGNGGIYPAIEKSGVLADMVTRGIEHIHTFAIDNSLVKPADPNFIGYCIQSKADCGNKVLWKSDPHEKVGVVAEKDGKPCVVEYSELSKDMAERLVVKEKMEDDIDDDPKLAYGAANICNHYYHIDFMQHKIIPDVGNMFHIAHKKIGTWDDAKKATVIPTVNNGIKLESFIFDVFPLSTSMAIYEVERRHEFAPIKNAPGSASDSPDTARAMISSLAKEWLHDAGARISANVDVTICISPLTSYGGEGLEMYKGKDIKCASL